MQVLFTRWSLTPESRTSVTVNPKRVDNVRYFNDAFVAATGEAFPAASVITMQGKQEYIVQGTVEAVSAALNEAESAD